MFSLIPAWTKHQWIHDPCWGLNQIDDKSEQNYPTKFDINPISGLFQNVQKQFNQTEARKQLERPKLNQTYSLFSLIMSSPTHFELNPVSGLSPNMHKPRCDVSWNAMTLSERKMAPSRFRYFDSRCPEGCHQFFHAYNNKDIKDLRSNHR